MRIVLANKSEDMIYLINTLTNKINTIAIKNMLNCWCVSDKYIIVLTNSYLGGMYMYTLDVYSLETIEKKQDERYPIIRHKIKEFEPKILHCMLSKDDNILTIYIENEVIEYRNFKQFRFMTKKCILYNKQTNEPYIKNIEQFPKSVDISIMKKINNKYSYINKCQPRVEYLFSRMGFSCKQHILHNYMMSMYSRDPCFFALNDFKFKERLFHRIALLRGNKYKIVDFLCDKEISNLCDRKISNLCDKECNEETSDLFDMSNKHNGEMSDIINKHDKEMSDIINKYSGEINNKVNRSIKNNHLTFFESELSTDFKRDYYINIMPLSDDYLLVKTGGKIFITDLMLNIQQCLSVTQDNCCSDPGSGFSNITPTQKYIFFGKIESMFKLKYSKSDHSLINNILEQLNNFMISNLVNITVGYMFNNFDANEILYK